MDDMRKAALDKRAALLAATRATVEQELSTATARVQQESTDGARRARSRRVKPGRRNRVARTRPGFLVTTVQGNSKC